MQLALVKLLAKCPGHTDQRAIRQVRTELAPLLAILDDSYLDWALECVAQALDPLGTCDVQPLVVELCSELICRRNPDSLYLLGRELVEGTGSFDDRWRHFVSVLRRRPQQMLGFLPIPESLAALLAPKCNLLPIAVARRETFSERPAYVQSKLEPFAVGAVVTVEAEDAKTAAFRSLEALMQSLYLVANQSQIGAFEHPPYAHVEYSGTGGTRIVRVRLDYTARWRDEDDGLCDALLDVLNDSHLLEEDRRRLQIALEYLRLGGLASSPATAFAHNWVALETLVRQGGMAIAEIRKYVPPLLCTGYARSLLRTFLDDCLRLEVDIAPIVGVGSPDVQDRALLRALRDPAGRAGILAQCSVSELLEARASELADLFRDGPSLAGLLENHSEHLGRHLQRMYRLRNAIVHAGESHSYVVPCLKHLSGYVQTALLEASRGIRAGGRSVGEILALLHHNHVVTVEELKSQTDFPEQLALDGSLLGDFDSPRATRWRSTC